MPSGSRRASRSAASSIRRAARVWRPISPPPRTPAASDVERPDKPSDLSEAALALDRELRRFAELADQAGRLKLNTEKNLVRATEALTRAAESQDKINAHVQELVAGVSVTRQKQESDAAALMNRAEEMAGGRKGVTEVLQRSAGLRPSAQEGQECPHAGAP